MVSNWLYWESPSTNAAPLATQKWKGENTKKYDGASVKKLKAAAAARKSATSTSSTSTSAPDAEYWEPLAIALPSTLPTPDPKAHPRRPNLGRAPGPIKDPIRSRSRSSPLRWIIPTGASIVAATVVRLQVGDPVGSALEDHVGGSLALAIVNSSWMPPILVGLTWYLIVMYIVELVEIARRAK